MRHIESLVLPRAGNSVACALRTGRAACHQSGQVHVLSIFNARTPHARGLRQAPPVGLCHEP
jgi:hypothetical protein